MIKPTGWNTWDVRCLNAVVHLPENLEIRFCIYNDARPLPKKYITEFRWDNLHRLGPHAPDGSYSMIELTYKGNIFSIEYGSTDEHHGPYPWTYDTPCTVTSTQKMRVVCSNYSQEDTGPYFATHTIVRNVTTAGLIYVAKDGVKGSGDP